MKDMIKLRGLYDMIMAYKDKAFNEVEEIRAKPDLTNDDYHELYRRLGRLDACLFIIKEIGKVL